MRAGVLQRFAVTIQAVAHQAQPRAQIIQILGGLIGHEHQGVADGLYWRSDIIQRRLSLTSMVQVQLQQQPVAQHVRGDVIDFVEIVVVIRLIGGFVECVDVLDHLAGAISYGLVILREKSSSLSS